MRTLTTTVAALLLTFGLTGPAHADDPQSETITQNNPVGAHGENLRTTVTVTYTDANSPDFPGERQLLTATVESGRACATVTDSHGRAYYAGTFKPDQSRYPVTMFGRDGCQTRTFDLGGEADIVTIAMKVAVKGGPDKSLSFTFPLD